MAGPAEPLGLRARVVEPPDGYGGLRATTFEYSSRGARVPGRLLLPPDDRGPFPLVLLEHGAGGSKDADALDAVAGPWAQRGAAVASIDLPLHGDRANAKLTALLQRAVAAPDAWRSAEALVQEFARQALTDLGRALDALTERTGIGAEIDEARITYAGFSLGALVGAGFCAGDHRPRAAALALAGAGLLPPEFDAAHHVPKIAPRPLLLVNTTSDTTIPRAAAEALYAAATEPKRQLWFEGTHAELPGAALKAMWEFLEPHLRA